MLVCTVCVVCRYTRQSHAQRGFERDCVINVSRFSKQYISVRLRFESAIKI